MSEINYAALKLMAVDLGRPVSSLLAQPMDSDPFYADLPMRRLRADWFAGIWRDLGMAPGAHLRRVHYRLVTTSEIPLPRVIAWNDPDDRQRRETTVYVNNRACWAFLGDAATDARYLGLVDYDHIVDRRNAHAVIHHRAVEECEASVFVSSSDADWQPRLWIPRFPGFPSLPALHVSAPTVDQRFCVEIWCEKATVDDVLVPLAESWGANLTSGQGDISLTRCHDLAERARAHGKPVRILTISDFDPGGASMPISLARKLEFLIHTVAPELDIQVRPVALTAEQVRRYNLPRNAIKESNRQAAEFQRKYGAGATELDAIESAHPGELGRIIEAELARYIDRDLDERIEAAAEEAQEVLDEITREVVAEHSVDELRAQHHELASEINSALAAFEQEINGRFRARIDSLAEAANGLFHGVTASLEARAPDSDDFDWPECAEGDEDGDALFDSTRDYVDQIDRFKKHQQKPTERKARGNGAGRARR